MDNSDYKKAWDNAYQTYGTILMDEIKQECESGGVWAVPRHEADEPSGVNQGRYWIDDSFDYISERSSGYMYYKLPHSGKWLAIEYDSHPSY